MLMIWGPHLENCFSSQTQSLHVFLGITVIPSQLSSCSFSFPRISFRDFPGGSVVKTLPSNAEHWIWSLVGELRQEEKGTTDDEMVGWDHQLDGHEFEQALGDGDRQGGLACCSPWCHKESDMTEDNYLTVLWFLPHIDMNQPQVHIWPPAIRNPPPTSSPPHSSRLPQSTGFEYPASCIELALVISFTYGNMHVSVIFSQIIPPLPIPKSKSLFVTSVSFAALYIGSLLPSF